MARSNNSASATSQLKDNDTVLREINDSLKELLSGGMDLSQSSLRDMQEGSRKYSGYGEDSRFKRRDSSESKFRGQGSRTAPGRSPFSSSRGSSSKGMMDDFLGSFEKQIMDGLGMSDIKGKLSQALGEFASDLGFDLQDIGKEAGKLLGNSVSNFLQSSGITDEFKREMEMGKGWLKDKFGGAMGNMRSNVDAYRAANGGSTDGMAFGDLFKKANGPQSSYTQEDSSDDDSVVDASDRFGDKAQSQIKNELSKQAKKKIKDELFKASAEGGEGVAATGKGASAVSMGEAAGSIGEASAALEGAAASAEGMGAAAAGAEGAMGAMGAEAAASGAGMAAAGEGAMAAGAACPYLAIAIVAVMVAMELLSEALGPAIEGFKELKKATEEAANRSTASAKKNTELAKERLKADADTLVKFGHEVMTSAAQAVVSSFQNALEKVTATQGYSKGDLQELMASYAERLRNEGLTRVVSSGKITENLARVIDSGLSGAVAEEFAYMATVLNEAVPTEDFFSYASTYASIAANAIANGQSQASAISFANQKLEEFANNLLFSSRELAGGFSSGLNNASALLEGAVKIANTARSSNITGISGVLTSVSAIVGAVAPDLADTLVNSVISAATGGNNSDLTALRSLAGTGASNSAFIRALAEDPQSVFATMFANLAKLQSSSSDNFMEVAEGLSNVFGLGTDAFARVDFQYLAGAIASMDTTSKALEANINLLKSGQTTSNQEQMEMQKINEYILENGLSYVIDNEAAMQIQQHMWDEQLARKMQEAEYAVSLQGAALSFLQGLSETVQNIMNLLNPFSWIKKLGNVIATAVEGAAMRADVAQLLALGNVGTGNLQQFYQLTTTNKDFNLIPSVVNMLGGLSTYELARTGTKAWQMLSGQGSAVGFSSANLLLGLVDNVVDFIDQNKPKSKYNWGMLGKSQAAALSAAYGGSGSGYRSVASDASAAAANATASRLNEFIDTIGNYIETAQASGQAYSYEEWAANAEKYGISDLAAALEDNSLSEQELKARFASQETENASKESHRRSSKEEDVWDASLTWYNQTEPERFEWLGNEFNIMESLLYNIDDTLLRVIHKDLSDEGTIHYDLSSKGMYAKFVEFFNGWKDYYINKSSYYGTDVAKLTARLNSIKKAEDDSRSLMLADALSSGLADITDPTAQTNLLLASILKVAEAIMQQNATSSSGVSLPNALSALGLGITT